MKIVINIEWGGWDNSISRLSAETIEKAMTNDEWDIIEIPDEAFYEIIDYDGMERIVWSREPLYPGKSVKSGGY